MYNNRTFYVADCDLSYKGKEIVKEMTELRFSTLPKAKDGSRFEPHSRHMIYRVSFERARSIMSAIYREEYVEKIAQKYNMPLDWENNRWFVEQVRPTL